MQVEQEPDFIKIYTRMVCVLKDVGKCSGLLGELLKRMNYASEGQKIVLNPEEAKRDLYECWDFPDGVLQADQRTYRFRHYNAPQRGCYTRTFL